MTVYLASLIVAPAVPGSAVPHHDYAVCESRDVAEDAVLDAIAAYADNLDSLGVIRQDEHREIERLCRNRDRAGAMLMLTESMRARFGTPIVACNVSEVQIDR